VGGCHFQQLTEAEKKQLCDVRAFLKLVQSSKDKVALANRLTIHDVPLKMHLYLTSEELREASEVRANVMANDIIRRNQGQGK